MYHPIEESEFNFSDRPLANLSQQSGYQTTFLPEYFIFLNMIPIQKGRYLKNKYRGKCYGFETVISYAVGVFGKSERRFKRR